MIFAIAMTLVLGSLLAFVSEGLKEKQQAEREFERKKFILGAALGSENIDQIIKKNKDDVNTIYASRVKDFVVDLDGKTIPDLAYDLLYFNFGCTNKLAKRQVLFNYFVNTKIFHSFKIS